MVPELLLDFSDRSLNPSLNLSAHPLSAGLTLPPAWCFQKVGPRSCVTECTGVTPAGWKLKRNYERDARVAFGFFQPKSVRILERVWRSSLCWVDDPPGGCVSKKTLAHFCRIED